MARYYNACGLGLQYWRCHAIRFYWYVNDYSGFAEARQSHGIAFRLVRRDNFRYIVDDAARCIVRTVLPGMILFVRNVAACMVW